MELGTYGLINVLWFSQGTGDEVSHTYPSPDNSVSYILHSPFILTQAAITEKVHSCTVCPPDFCSWQKMITVIDRDNNQERYQPMGSVSGKDQLRICPCQVRDGGNSFPTETQWFISSNYSPVTIPIISWSGYETQWLQVYETSYRVPLQSPSFFCLLSTASYVYLHIHELCKN